MVNGKVYRENKIKMICPKCKQEMHLAGNYMKSEVGYTGKDSMVSVWQCKCGYTKKVQEK